MLFLPSVLGLLTGFAGTAPSPQHGLGSNRSFPAQCLVVLSPAGELHGHWHSHSPELWQGGRAMRVWVSAPGKASSDCGYGSWDWLGKQRGRTLLSDDPQGGFLFVEHLLYSRFWGCSAELDGEESQGSQVSGLHSWASGGDIHRSRGTGGEEWAWGRRGPLRSSWGTWGRPQGCQGASGHSQMTDSIFPSLLMRNLTDHTGGTRSCHLQR